MPCVLCVSIQVMASIGSTVTSVQLMTVMLFSTVRLVTQALDSASMCFLCKRQLSDIVTSSAGFVITVEQY